MPRKKQVEPEEKSPILDAIKQGFSQGVCDTVMKVLIDKFDEGHPMNKYKAPDGRVFVFELKLQETQVDK